MRTLLRRWGILFFRLLAREAAWLPPWREILTCCRRLEARGEIRGGRFVAGFPGEQYAAPEAIGLLRDVRRQAVSSAGSDVALERQILSNSLSLSAADPLNLVGLVTPGARLAALTGNRVLYGAGLPAAVLAAGEVIFLESEEGLGSRELWEIRNALLRRTSQRSGGAPQPHRAARRS